MSLLADLGLPEARCALLVTADDDGLCYSATEGVLEAVRSGAVTGVGLAVAAPFSRVAARRLAEVPSVDVGVELVVTSPFRDYPVGPITFAPSLLGGDGGFPMTVDDLHDHADPDEVRRECRAQLERAVLLGIRPAHVSVRQGALFAMPALFDVLVSLAVESSLPLRLPPRGAAGTLGFPLHDLADAAGVVHPDHVAWGSDALADPDAFIAGLSDGITELVVHPAVDDDELHSIAPDAEARIGDLDRLLAFGGVVQAAARASVPLLRYEQLAALARSRTPRPR